MNSSGQTRMRDTNDVDVLIIGSGPVGATFARTIADALPSAKILIIEAGPQLSSRPGMNVRNIADQDERSKAQLVSQGPTPFHYDSAEVPGVPKYRLEALAKLARPGTFLVNAEPERPADLPGAGASSNVGGMGAHWTCACPRPGDGERVPFIPAAEMERALTRAEALLHVRTDSFPPSLANHRITLALGRQFQSPDARPVGPMPLACTRLPSGERVWTGSDTVLGWWGDRLNSHAFDLHLRTETLCRRLLQRGDTITGAVLEHLPTGRQEEVRARFVVVAADSLRSPQLLWASEIRPRALGHYLNEHPQILSAVQYEPGESTEPPDASELGVFWVPFHERDHPYHGQIMPLSVSPIPMGDGSAPVSQALTVALCWFCRKDIQFRDHIEFSSDKLDFYGMPSMTMHYSYTQRDEENFQAAIREQTRAAACIGSFLPNQTPALLPSGRSLHYQGTMRMGAEDDDASVCDSYSRVWAFKNLFLGGNGVIPTATACNPTLTTVGLAIRSAEHLVSLLAAG